MSSRAAQEIGNGSRVSVTGVAFLTSFLVGSYSNVLLLAWPICLKTDFLLKMCRVSKRIVLYYYDMRRNVI